MGGTNPTGSCPSLRWILGPAAGFAIVSKADLRTSGAALGAPKPLCQVEVGSLPADGPGEGICRNLSRVSTDPAADLNVALAVARAESHRGSEGDRHAASRESRVRVHPRVLYRTLKPLSSKKVHRRHIPGRWQPAGCGCYRCHCGAGSGNVWLCATLLRKITLKTRTGIQVRPQLSLIGLPQTCTQSIFGARGTIIVRPNYARNEYCQHRATGDEHADQDHHIAYIHRMR